MSAPVKAPVALLGLSADPPHRGHFELSYGVMQVGYPRVWWSIAPANPFKKGRGRASYAHRHALASLLIQDHAASWLELNNVEAGLTVVEESVRTLTLLRHLHRIYGDSYDFTFVMGSDNWKKLHTWSGFEELLDHGGILVTNRGDEVETLQTCEAARFYADKQDDGTGVLPQGRWRLMPAFFHSASSTAIADQLGRGETPRDLTPGQLRYIRQHDLYKGLESPANA